MAITPNSYPFSGGAFMGGGGSPVNRDDIHTLNLTKNGESIGNYNPLVGDADVDIPSDAVVISFSTFSGTMPGTAYSKMSSAVGAGQVVMLRSVSSASVVYWTLLAASVLSYRFISVSETAVLTVEIQTSGDSSGNHAFTISNVPLTELRVIDTGASSGDDRGHEHTRITEALAAGKTVCIKYTSGNNTAYGTLCGAHDGHYTFLVDYGGTPSVLTVIADGSMQITSILNGDGSEITATFSAASTRTNIVSGEKLSVLFGKIAKWLGDLGTAAFKALVTSWSDTTSNNNIPSEKLVKDSLDGKADKASITGATKCKITYNEQGIVTAGDDLGASDIPDLPASKITSGAFGTDRIADDAITAAKVKDNETLPVSVSGAASQLSHVTSQNEASTWRQIAKLESSDANRVLAQGFAVAVRDRINDNNYYTGTYIVSCTSKGSDCKILQGTRLANLYDMKFVVAVDSNSITLYANSSQYSPYHVTALFGNPTIAIGNALGSKPAGTDVAKTFLLDTIGQIGSPSIPVYVNPDGQVLPCNVLSGSTSNFNKRFTWTYTVSQNDQYITTSVINDDNINHIAEYVEWHNANVGKLTHPPLIILSVSARTDVANAGLISLCMYRNGEGCDVIGEDYTYMGNVHGSSARNTQYFTDRPFYNGEPYYLCIRNETSNPMWTAGTILDISIRIVAHAVSIT